MLPDLPRAPIPAAQPGSRNRALLGERIPVALDHLDGIGSGPAAHAHLIRLARIQLDLARVDLAHLSDLHELAASGAAGAVQVREVAAAVRGYERRLRRARKHVALALNLTRRSSWRAWWTHTQN
ncbi:hypothetical protein ACIBG8_54590 [Nonomuraea sp. NPDC050556]|uniref:hypothetical protein n=1 Tax=Nonomuraea sp. NPDC050556 TaxID=3364369 RepID=UPI0037B1F421